MSEKLCVFCIHHEWERIHDIYYSTLTGGDVFGGFNCLKGHYNEERPFSDEDYRALLLRGETCPDYEPPEIRTAAAKRKAE